MPFDEKKNPCSLSQMKDIKSKRKDTKTKCSPWVTTEADTAQRMVAAAARTSVLSEQGSPHSNEELLTPGRI